MDPETRTFGQILLLMGLFIVGLVAVLAGLSGIGGYLRLASADNVIHNYEWFFDAKNTVDARVAQIAAEKELVAGETDKDELRRLRVDLGGMQQSCRDLVADYNSNASKATREVFQSNSLPDRLDAGVCE